MQLPRPVSASSTATGGGARYNVVALAAVDAAGRLSARLAARGVPWIARRVVVQGPAGSTCSLYTGEPMKRNLADGTQSGALDVADYFQPPFIEPSVELVAVWLDVNGGNVTGEALIRVELEELG